MYVTTRIKNLRNSRGKRKGVITRNEAIEMGLKFYEATGKIRYLYCPDCGVLLSYHPNCKFVATCSNDDCHFIGYNRDKPVREAIPQPRGRNHSEVMKKRWAEPGYREKQAQISKDRWNSFGYRERVVKNMKKRWEDPEYKAEMSKNMKKRCEDPEYLERLSQRMKEHWRDPEFREKTILGHKMAIEARSRARQ